MTSLTLGIDQSLNHTGIVILAHDYSLIHEETFEPKGTEAAKLSQILDRMFEILKDYSIDRCVREDFAFASVGRKYTLGAVAGMIDVACYRRGVEMITVAPKSREKYATGKGKASKSDVITAVKKWGYVTEDDNRADAFVLAHIGVSLDAPKTRSRAELEVLQVVRAKIPQTPKK